MLEFDACHTTWLDCLYGPPKVCSNILGTPWLDKICVALPEYAYVKFIKCNSTHQ